jgi:uncharacterized protein YegL
MNEGFQNFNRPNFDPNSLANMTSSVIMFAAVFDKSPSVDGFASDMNMASQEIFMKELKNCHRKDDIVIKKIEFNEKVDHASGFMPIVNLQDDYLNVRPGGHATSLYQAVLEALEHCEKYRTDLENNGVDVRTSIFIMTDGQDNNSPASAANEVKKKIAALRQNEAWMSSFTITMLGVGEERYFRQACIEMGLDPDKCLTTIGANVKDIRKQFGVVSQSVSSSAAAAAVNF